MTRGTAESIEENNASLSYYVAKDNQFCTSLVLTEFKSGWGGEEGGCSEQLTAQVNCSDHLTT